MGCRASVYVLCSLCLDILRRSESSLSMVKRGFCVVRGECWPTDVMRLLSVRVRVVRCVGARLVRWILLVSFLSVREWVSVVLRRKQYIPKILSNYGRQVC